MSCCGKKREEWLHGKKQANFSNEKTTVSEALVKTSFDSLFEFTGTQSFRIEGSITGRIYHFRFHGHRLKVHGNDSWALMAERELKYLGKA